MVLFRFYDARILLAFLGTLSATDAAAFWGQSERLFAVHDNKKPAVVTRPTRSGPPTLAAPLAAPYAINTQQIEMVTQITDQVFRSRLSDFLRSLYPEQSATLTEKDRLALVAQAIQDCEWLEVCREGDVVGMAVIRLVRPDLGADEAYRDAVVDQLAPNRRLAAYLGEMTFQMEPEDKQAFFNNLSSWWKFTGEPQ